MNFLTYTIFRLTQSQLRTKLLHPLRKWLNKIESHTPALAYFICWFIPSSYLFQRDKTFLNHTLVHIPVLCTLNPLDEESVRLRLRAQKFLNDQQNRRLRYD